MRLCLTNPSNPIISIVNIKESRWNCYRVWKPLSLMVLAGLTPPEWEISIVDENTQARRPTDCRGRLPLINLMGNFSYRNYLRLNRKAHRDAKRQQGNRYGLKAIQT